MTSHPDFQSTSGSGGWVSRIGPALILAIVVIGPGSLTLNTIAGGSYEYHLLWVPVTATFFMMVYTQIVTRISLVTGQTLFDITRQHYSPHLARIGSLVGFSAIVAFQAGNSAAVGFAASGLFGHSHKLWASLLTVVGFVLVMLPNLYQTLETFVKIVVGLMLISFVGTLAMVGVRGSAALAGLVPSFPDDEAVFLSVGMASTTFSILAAVYQGYLVREKGWGVAQLRTGSLDSLIGIGILGFISIILLMTSAAVMKPSDTFTVQAMASQLQPLVGPLAFYLFGGGFLLASFSSLVVNPLIGATLLADGLGQDSKMGGRPVKMYTAIAIVVGLAVVLVFDGSPVELLRIAQAFAIIAFPILGFLVLAIGRSRSMMGEYVISWPVSALGVAGYVVLLAIVMNYIRILAGMI